MGRRLAIAWLLLAALAIQAAEAVRVGPTGRYLVDDAGRPFLLVGDAAWSLIAQLPIGEAELYLQERAAMGFNTVIASLIEHAFSESPPRNFYGDLPFNGALFVTPNEAYFAHADAVLAAAAACGITVFLAPTYLGHNCGSQGWCAEIMDASPNDMRSWGAYLGWRYRDFSNVVWLIGGDADPSAVRDKLREVVAGIRIFDPIHLISTHSEPGSTARASWPGEAWLQVDNLYTFGSDIYADGRDALLANPALPFFLIESTYENEGGVTPQQLRAQSYWTVLSGGFGHVFGNCPLWHFDYSAAWCDLSDWQAQLDGQGSLNMLHFGRLFRSRHWERLVPDFVHTVVTAGYGNWLAPDYATAASTRDRTSILVYLPSPRTITVDTSTLAGDSARVWWYDPATGAAHAAGTIPTGQASLVPPGAGDWVLVLDDAALDWPAPGQERTSAAGSNGPALDPTFQLLVNAPNPFNAATDLFYGLERASRVRVAVYNAAGALVRVLYDGRQIPGRHALRWDGRDTWGSRAGAGVYFCRLEAETGSAVRRMLLLR